jgi:hypothetical protein
VDITPFNITWNGDNLQNLNPDASALEYQGGSVPAWLQLKSALLVTANPEIVFPLHSLYRFRKPTTFYKNGKEITLRSMEAYFTPKVQWFTEVVRLDATSAVFDYIHGGFHFPAGTNSFTFGPIDWDKGTPVSSPPNVEDLGLGLGPDALDVIKLFPLAKVHGTSPNGVKVADLDSLVNEHDIKLRLSPDELKKLERGNENLKLHRRATSNSKL